MKHLLTKFYMCKCGDIIEVYKGTYMENHMCKKCKHSGCFKLNKDYE